MITTESLFEILETLSSHAFECGMKVCQLAKARPLDHATIEPLLAEEAAYNDAYDVIKKLLDARLPADRDPFIARVTQ